MSVAQFYFLFVADIRLTLRLVVKMHQNLFCGQQNFLAMKFYMHILHIFSQFTTNEKSRRLFLRAKQRQLIFN